MAISPPSDIVLDVMRAADPARSRQASAALNRGRSVPATATAMVASPRRQAGVGAFAERLAVFEKAPARMPATDSAWPGVRLPPARATATPADKRPHRTAAAISPMRTGMEDHTGPMVPPARRDAVRRALAGLESLLVQSLMEGALGGGGGTVFTGGLFGGGLAGDYWRSLFAETVARRIADGGGLGMADSLMHARTGLAAAAVSAAVASSGRGEGRG